MQWSTVLLIEDLARVGWVQKNRNIKSLPLV